MSHLKLRNEIDVSLIQENGNNFIYISDPLLISEPIALPFAYYPLIQTLIEGNKTAEEIVKDGTSKLLNLSEERVYKLLENLGSLFLLENKITKNATGEMLAYIDSPIRESYCHGFSYPEEPELLNQFLDLILSKKTIDNTSKFDAILAPHIDLRLEESWEVYANSFSHLSSTDNVDTVILFGTAHYKSSADFMFTDKNFRTPLGLLETDQEMLKIIESHTDVHFDDIAHYKEHSLEFHLLFLQKLLPNKNFKILPILNGSFANFIDEDQNPLENEEFERTINAIKTSVESLGRNVLILSSGDLSHVGRKFGDNFNAKNEENRIAKDDKVLIELLSKADYNGFYNIIKENGDKNRICGTSPFYSALALSGCENVQSVGYNHWYEEETESIVSFAGFVAAK